MTPKILQRSKNIYRDHHFEDRLYYKSSNSPLNTKKATTYANNVNQYEYKPKLNKNSIKIANQLEPSSTRLLKKKKRYNSQTNIIRNNSLYSSSSRDRSNSKSSKENMKKINDLYNKGMEHKQQREKIFQENKQKKDLEYQNYSFHPKIIKSSPLLDESNCSVKSTSKGKDIYKRQTEWKKKLENETMKKREKIENQKNKDFTFKPEISHLNIQNDEKFIMRNIQQMNDYVNKRREAIQRQKELEDYKNKRLGISSNNNYNPSAPKGFVVGSGTRNPTRRKSHSKSPDRKSNDINPIRDQLGTYQFFNNMNNNKNIYQSNNINPEGFNNNIQNKEDFVQAVNILSNRIQQLDL